MKKPYVICHMTTSINGKITGKYLEKANFAVNEYYRLHREFHADAFLCGRKTMESSFTNSYYPDLTKYKNIIADKNDFIDSSHDFYAIAIDFHAKLGWQNNYISDDDPGYNNAYIIEVLSENTDESFLNYLREKRISYIFAGKEQFDVSLMLYKLKELFNINLLLLEGGGIINGTFLNEDLIDELSIVIAPYIEYSNETKELFFNDNTLLKKFNLYSHQLLEDHSLHLKYKK